MKKPTTQAMIGHLPQSPQPSGSEISLRSTSHARDKFLSNRSGPSMPVSGVRPFIYQSWKRSASEGIQSEQFGAPVINSGEEIQVIRRENSDLYRSARGSFEQIGKMLSDTEAMLILTDRTGVVIETNGDKSTLEYGRKINLGLGGVWSENASGTNGIGTALWTGLPVFVHGTEHFCEGMRAWSCAAAPIRDPLDGSILGVVDLSGLTTIFQKHNAAFAVAAAGEIQAVLAQDQSIQHMRLLEDVIGKVPLNETGREGLVVVDHLGRIIYSRNLENAAPANENGLDVSMGKQFANLSHNLSDREIISSLPEELACKEIRRLKIDGFYAGAAFVFNPLQKRQHYRVNSVRHQEPSLQIAGTDLKIVGESPEIQSAIESLRQIESVDAATLIEGETGVGKELFARYIHACMDPDETRKFWAVNCGAASKKMFVDTLYASMNTGPINNGHDTNDLLTESDAGGVFCLDEIGELPVSIQPSLLRALDDPHGAQNVRGQTLPKNFRVISMTNRDLQTEVQAGRFRSDLYYRISAVTLKIPPLRERGNDILLIASYFNRQIATSLNNDTLIFAPDAQEKLLAYFWPGNVRELRNLVSSLHYKAKNRHVGNEDLPQRIQNPAVLTQRQDETLGTNKHPVGSFKKSEEMLILTAISKHKGNLSKAAETLGISRPTLYRKMNIYSIDKGS